MENGSVGGGVVTLVAGGRGGERREGGTCGASTLSLAAPFYPPVGGSRFRGPGWLATTLCAGEGFYSTTLTP